MVDIVKESNFTAYIAVGLLHHIGSTGDHAFLDRMWPTVVAALDFTLGLQMPGGEIRWARGGDGLPAEEALLTGCSSMFHSLRCALALARLRGEPQPDWELAATTLGHAVAAHEDRFSPRERYSMDWYYPILGGAVAWTNCGRAHRRGLGTIRGTGPGTAVRERPAMGDRRGDLRTGARVVRARRA